MASAGYEFAGKFIEAISPSGSLNSPLQDPLTFGSCSFERTPRKRPRKSKRGTIFSSEPCIPTPDASVEEAPRKPAGELRKTQNKGSITTKSKLCKFYAPWSSLAVYNAFDYQLNCYQCCCRDNCPLLTSVQEKKYKMLLCFRFHIFVKIIDSSTIEFIFKKTKERMKLLKYSEISPWRKRAGLEFQNKLFCLLILLIFLLLELELPDANC